MPMSGDPRQRTFYKVCNTHCSTCSVAPPIETASQLHFGCALKAPVAWKETRAYQCTRVRTFYKVCNTHCSTCSTAPPIETASQLHFGCALKAPVAWKETRAYECARVSCLRSCRNPSLSLHQARCIRKGKTLGVTELGGGRWDGWRQPGLNEHCEQPFYIQIKSGACTVAAIRPPASHQARCTRKERTLGVAGLGGGQWDGWRQSCLNEHSRSEGAIRQLRPAPPRTSGPSPLWRRRRRSSRRLRPCGSARDRSTC
jgi:hypothetical protein